MNHIPHTQSSYEAPINLVTSSNQNLILVSTCEMYMRPIKPQMPNISQNAFRARRLTQKSVCNSYKRPLTIVQNNTMLRTRENQPEFKNMNKSFVCKNIANIHHKINTNTNSKEKLSKKFIVNKSNCQSPKNKAYKSFCMGDTNNFVLREYRRLKPLPIEILNTPDSCYGNIKDRPEIVIKKLQHEKNPNFASYEKRHDELICRMLKYRKNKGGIINRHYTFDETLIKENSIQNNEGIKKKTEKIIVDLRLERLNTQNYEANKKNSDSFNDDWL